MITEQKIDASLRVRDRALTLAAVFCIGLVVGASGKSLIALWTRHGPMDSIRLKDYRPDSSLIVPRSKIDHSRFRVVDAHSHTYVETPDGIANWVRLMDQAGVDTSIILTEATGSRFDTLVDLFLKPYPGRFQLYCGIDTRNIDDPQYPFRVVAELERCYRKGARGVGEVIDKGSGLTQGPMLPRNRRLHPDDPRLDRFWAKCAQLKLPVSLHMADHPSAWRPPDIHQERSPEYQQYNQYGKDVPTYEEMLAMRDRTLRRHPETLFVLCHLGNQGNDLASLGKLLDAFPRLYVDISGRDYEIGRQPRFASQFLTRYKDRVLFGTDQSFNSHAAMYLSWWRLFETPDEYLPSDAGWHIYGMDLPDSVLQMIYHDNAKRILNWG